MPCRTVTLQVQLTVGRQNEWAGQPIPTHPPNVRHPQKIEFHKDFLRETNVFLGGVQVDGNKPATLSLFSRVNFELK